MNIRTVWHWREVMRWALICVVLIPTLSGGVIYLATMLFTVPVWAAMVFGLVVGVTTTIIYTNRRRLWRFER